MAGVLSAVLSLRPSAGCVAVWPGVLSAVLSQAISRVCGCVAVVLSAVLSLRPSAGCVTGVLSTVLSLRPSAGCVAVWLVYSVLYCLSGHQPGV